jgi:hypothetical protein
MRQRPAAGLALAAVLLGACTTEVRLTPGAADWKVAGDEATWTSGDVAVVASLDASHGKFPIRGEVRARTPVEVAFVPLVSSEGGDVGETPVSGEPGARTSPIASRVFVAAPDGATVVAFAIRPDVEWRSTPVPGSTVSYSVVVRTTAGDVTCPFRFRVDVSETHVTTLGMIGIGAGTALILGAILIGATTYFAVTSF